MTIKPDQKKALRSLVGGELLPNDQKAAMNQLLIELKAARIEMERTADMQEEIDRLIKDLKDLQHIKTDHEKLLKEHHALKKTHARRVEDHDIDGKALYRKTIEFEEAKRDWADQVVQHEYLSEENQLLKEHLRKVLAVPGIWPGPRGYENVMCNAKQFLESLDE